MRPVQTLVETEKEKACAPVSVPELFQAAAEGRQMKQNGHISNRAEATFAQLLTNRGLEFEHQPQGFRLYYRPDFYVPAEECYYEVVGTRQALALNRGKIETFLRTYPHVKLGIVNSAGVSVRLPTRRIDMRAIAPAWRHLKRQLKEARRDVVRLNREIQRKRIQSQRNIAKTKRGSLHFMEELAPGEAQIRRQLERNRQTGRGPRSLYQLAQTWGVSRSMLTMAVKDPKRYPGVRARIEKAVAP